MANRRFYNSQYSYERDLTDIFAKITIGAAGAPTLESNAKGIKSVTRSSAGDYVIALTDSFNKLMAVDAIVRNATGIPTSTVIGLKADSVASATAPSIEIVCSAAGSAADPASGDVLMLHIACRNAST